MDGFMSHMVFLMVYSSKSQGTKIIIMLFKLFLSRKNTQSSVL